MDLKYEVVEGIAFTYANGVKGTLNYYDTQALLYEMEALEPDSKYVEIGSYLGCSGVIAGLNYERKSPSILSRHVDGRHDTVTG
jgi:hypothetical protein